MDLVPKTSIKSLSIGDMLTGQDGNKYVVCKKANVLYWKPEEEKPTPPIVSIKEKKPKFEHDGNDDKLLEVAKRLLPKDSASNKAVGYVWKTKFSNIYYVVDIEYKGGSKTSEKFWNFVCECPPRVEADKYSLKHISGNYCVAYDDKYNKYWCKTNQSHEPLQNARNFVEGTYETGRDGKTYVSRRNINYEAVKGDAFWKKC